MAQKGVPEEANPSASNVTPTRLSKFVLRDRLCREACARDRPESRVEPPTRLAASPVLRVPALAKAAPDS
jgi:hypothetical protein